MEWVYYWWRQVWCIHFDRFFTYFIHVAASIIREVLTPFYTGRKCDSMKLDNIVGSFSLCFLYSSHLSILLDIMKWKIAKHVSDHWLHCEVSLRHYSQWEAFSSLHLPPINLHSPGYLYSVDSSCVNEKPSDDFFFFLQIHSIHGHSDKWDEIGSGKEIQMFEFQRKWHLGERGI